MVAGRRVSEGPVLVRGHGDDPRCAGSRLAPKGGGRRFTLEAALDSPRAGDGLLRTLGLLADVGYGSSPTWPGGGWGTR